MFTSREVTSAAAAAATTATMTAMRRTERRGGCGVVSDMAESSVGVPDVPVAFEAGELLRCAGLAGVIDRRRQLRMAAAAGSLGDGAVARSDLDRLLEAAGGEGEGVVPAVQRLGEPLPGEVVRGVAIVADRDGVVAGAGPPLELLAHDVAVHARLRVVGQIGAAARVGEGEAADADQHAEGEAD